MAEKTELSVSVKADIDNLLKNMGKGLKSVQDFKDQLARFKTSLDKATDPASVLRLNKAIEATQNRIKAISSAGTSAGAGFSKISSGADTAGQSLQNLGRIAQDAPFGFIGIANNINPLLESFQRLKAESKATGTSITKNLVASLVGGGGLGLAISLVSAGLSFATIGLQAWKGRHTESKAAVDESKKATEEFVESLKKVEASGITAGIQLKNFVNIAKDQTQSLATRNQALESANKILGEHGEKLTLVNIATQAVTDQINKFTQATIQQALATKFADRAADLFINQKDAAKLYGVELAKLRELEKKTLSFENAQGVRVLTDAGKEVEKQRRVVAQLATGYKGVTGDLKNIVNELQAAQLAASQLFGALDTPKDITGIIAKIKAELKSLNDVQPTLISEKAIAENVARIKVLEAELDRLLGKTRKPAVVKDIKTVNDVLGEMRKQIALLNKEEIGFNTDNAEERYNTFLNAIKTLNLKFGKSLDSDLLKGLFSEAKFAKAGLIIENGFAKLGVAAKKSFDAAMKNIAPPEDLTIPISFDVKPIESGLSGQSADTYQKLFGIPAKTADRLKKEAFVLGKNVSTSFGEGVRSLGDADFDAYFDAFIERMRVNQQAVADIFSTMAEAVGKGVAGGGKVLSQAFSGILNIVGDYLVKMGKAAVVLSKVITGIKAGNAITGFAAGLIAIAAGSILKSIKLPAFANGVQNFSGGLAMVGERGPELVNLPRGSDVIPNHELSGSFGGQSVFIPEARVKGQDIVIAFKRASATNSRNGF